MGYDYGWMTNLHCFFFTAKANSKGPRRHSTSVHVSSAPLPAEAHHGNEQGIINTTINTHLYTINLHVSNVLCNNTIVPPHNTYGWTMD